MSEPLLLTKFFIPPPRPHRIPRPRLIERLEAGLGCTPGVTLISASAGFGKTTLVSEWIAGAGRPAAWLSLDEGDNDLARFLAYFIAALQTIDTNMGAGALAVLHASSPQIPPAEAILVALLNEITTFPGSFIFVLDDYHSIDCKPIDLALTFLIEHLPPQMHLVIATREDPDLPLARLRARGQLTELRAADLRFTAGEAAEFLNQGMGLNLSPKDVVALESRTEGWVAGLQFAALSMQGRPDAAGFVKAFTGSHRFVLDYLVEEVLQRQVEAVRSFLLQTSILERLCGSLCDAITGREDGRKMLGSLERDNLFIVPLDDQRQWYRYHHLFADFLRAHLMEEQPAQAAGLHRRACEWYEHNGLRSDAIRHAMAAKDFERAAGLIELAHPAMDISYQSARWLGWAKALPDERVRARPVLSAGYAAALLDAGEMEAAEGRLRDAEHWLELAASLNCLPPGMVVTDNERFQTLPASIAASRAYQSQALGNLSDTIHYARLVLSLTSEEDHTAYIQATALLGLTYWASGDLEAADQAFTHFIKDRQAGGNLVELIGTTFVLAEIKAARGRLREAVSSYLQSLQLAANQGESVPAGTADLYRGVSELYCEQGDLEAAAEHLRTARKLGEQVTLTDWQHRLALSEARYQAALGNLDGALASLDEAERLYVRSPLPDVRPIAALKARIWVRQGRLAEALAWARERGVSADDPLSYLDEFEHITLCKVLLAHYQIEHQDSSIQPAIKLLERLLKAAEAGGRTGSVIEIRVGLALAHQAQGSRAAAFACLERALALAEPEGYVRVFADEGAPLAELLQEAAKRGAAPAYVNRLRAALGKAAGPAPAAQAFTGHPAQPVKSGLVEPLSERERQVLRLFKSELNGPEIARELVVSLNTLRTHTQSIYTKLGVNNRRAAVRRAEELHLI